MKNLDFVYVTNERFMQKVNEKFTVHQRRSHILPNTANELQLQTSFSQYLQTPVNIFFILLSCIFNIRQRTGQQLVEVLSVQGKSASFLNLEYPQYSAGDRLSI